LRDTRPVIVGMNNPLSTSPEHALFPAPDGCTGHRIWRMLNERTGCTRGQYLAAFDRRNLVVGDWSAQVARDSAAQLISGMERGRVVVVLGEGPRRALDLPRQLIRPVSRLGVVWRQIPHPSGRCRFYNDPVARAVVALLLEELYRGETEKEED
jgi:hypothetical protein